MTRGWQRRGRLFVIASILLSSILASLAVCAAAAQKQPPVQPVNLNTATLKELEELPGVGPVTAKAIVQFRQKSGPFHRVEELLVIRGISESKLAQMRRYVMVAPAPARSVAPPRPARP